MNNAEIIISLHALLNGKEGFMLDEYNDFYDFKVCSEAKKLGWLRYGIGPHTGTGSVILTDEGKRLMSLVSDE